MTDIEQYVTKVLFLKKIRYKIVENGSFKLMCK